MVDDFLSQIEFFFHDELGKCTSGLIYGSFVTGDWAASRSDLDIIIYLESQDHLKLFEEQFWKWRALYPPELLDGFLVFNDGSKPMTKRFYKFTEPPSSLYDSVLIPDQWKIRNQSNRLFGSTKISEFFPVIQPEDLKNWAIRNKQEYWIPSILKTIENLENSIDSQSFPLNNFIWMVSGAARIKTLEQSGMCSSKKEAIRWALEEEGGPAELLELLLENFEKPDSESPMLSLANAISISRFSLEICQS